MASQLEEPSASKLNSSENDIGKLFQNIPDKQSETTPRALGEECPVPSSIANSHRKLNSNIDSLSYPSNRPFGNESQAPRQHLNGSVTLHILAANSLMAVDSNGLSDPFIKVIHGDKSLFKSSVKKKTLDPVWTSENVTFNISESSVLIELKDYNNFSGAKDLGVVQLDLNTLFSQATQFDQWFDISQGTGRIHLKGILHPDVFQRGTTTNEPVSNMKKSETAKDISEITFLDGTVTLTILGATSLMAVDSNGFSDPYIKVNHGGGKSIFKTSVKKKTLEPVWSESTTFELSAKTIKLTVKDYNFSGSKELGYVMLDLTELFDKGCREFQGWYNVQEGTGKVHGQCSLVVKNEIEGSSPKPALIENLKSGPVPNKNAQEELLNKYKSDEMLRPKVSAFAPTTVSPPGMKIENISGTVHLNIIAARKLMSVDANGFSDPFVRVFREPGVHVYKTAIKKKTLDPSWIDEVVALEVPEFRFRLEIKDFNNFTNDKDLGYIVLDVRHLFTAGVTEFDEWFEIKEGEGQIRIKGNFEPYKANNTLTSKSALSSKKGEFDVENTSEVTFQISEIESASKPSLPQMDSLKKSRLSMNQKKPEQISGTVTFCILGGSNLLAVDSNGLSDPFIKVIHGGTTIHQTSVKKKTLDPIWTTETIKLDIPDYEIVLEIKDFNEFGDKDLGFVKLDLSDYFRGTHDFDEWIPVEDGAGKIHIKGSLGISKSETISTKKSLSPSPVIAESTEGPIESDELLDVFLVNLATLSYLRSEKAYQFQENNSFRKACE